MIYKDYNVCILILLSLKSFYNLQYHISKVYVKTNLILFLLRHHQFQL